MKKILILLFLIPAFSFAVNFNKNVMPKAFDLKIRAAEKELLSNNASLLSQALIASGVAPTYIRKYMNSYQKLLSNFKALSNGLDNYKKADRLLEYLHNTVLKRYHEKADGIDIVFTRGIFNCVTSSILYNIVLKDLGIQSRGVLLPEHVTSQVAVNGKWLDTETTVAQGFDAGNNKKAAKSFEKITGYVYVPSSRRGNNVTYINLRDYIALIYSNRGVFAMERSNYNAALNHLYKASLVAPHLKDVLKNFMGAYNNYALYFMNQKNFKKAEEVIKEAITFFPDSKTLQDNQRKFYRNWAYDLSKQGQHENAIALIKQNARFFGDQDLENLHINWIIQLKEDNSKLEKAYELVQKAEKLFPLSRSVEQLKKEIIQKLTKFYAAQGSKNKALNLLQAYKIENSNDVLFISHLYFFLQEFQRARAVVEQALRSSLNAKYFDVLSSIMYTYVTKYSKVDEAFLILIENRKYLDRAYYLRKNYQDILNVIAAHYMRRNQADKALAQFERLKKYPKLLPLAYEVIGRIYYTAKIYPFLRARQFDKAIKAFEQGLKLTNNSSNLLKSNYKIALSNHAASLYRQRNYEDAYEVIKKAAKIYRNDSLIIRNLRAIAYQYLKILQKTDQNKYEKVQRELRELIR